MFIFTDHTRTTWEGNALTGVCHSVQEGGSISHHAPGQVGRRRPPPPGKKDQLEMSHPPPGPVSKQQTGLVSQGRV